MYIAVCRIYMYVYCSVQVTRGSIYTCMYIAVLYTYVCILQYIYMYVYMYVYCGLPAVLFSRELDSVRQQGDDQSI